MPSLHRGRGKLVLALGLPVGALVSRGAAEGDAYGEAVGRGSSPGGAPTESTAGTTRDADTGATTPGGTTTERVETSDGGEVVVVRDGVWEVGDAGGSSSAWKAAASGSLTRGRTRAGTCEYRSRPPTRSKPTSCAGTWGGRSGPGSTTARWKSR